MSVQAVFLDRDGVINKEVNLLYQEDQLELIPGSAEAIRCLNKAGILAIVVTNQPVVARALCNEEDVRRIHSRLAEMIYETAGAKLDAVYFCPHHPETHHKDGNPAYRGSCQCRKPNIGMLEQARTTFNLDYTRCFVVGDSTRDIQTGVNADCRTILVQTGYAGNDDHYDVKADHVAKDLAAAVDIILGIHLKHNNSFPPEKHR
jgi:histidinol-phosphate phosphatase family protein